MVSVDLRNVTNIPEGAELKVEEVKPNKYDEYLNAAAEALNTNADAFTYAKLLDISIVYEGQEIQPNGKVGVEIQLKDGEDVTNPQVVHFGQEPEVLDAAKTGNGVAFATTGFSVYAIINDGSEPTIRATYKFQNADGTSYYFIDNAGNSVDNQIIKNGEYLEDVGRPDIKAGETFSGWHLYDPDNDTYGDQVLFGESHTISVTENAIYYVRPVFGDVAYINFYEDSEGTNIYQRVQVVLTNGSASYDISKQNLDAPKSSLAFVGWNETAGTDGDSRSAITNTTVTISGDKNYYPVFKKAHWIHFHANLDGETGASYTAPKFVIVGQTAASAKPSDPTWKGHVFRYWSETKPEYDEQGNLTNTPEEFDFNQTLDEREDDVELYAVWGNGQTTYTVIFWKQKVTDDKNAEEKSYDYVSMDTPTATTGEVIKASDFSEQFHGFSVHNSDTSIVVKADGSSVLNIYFDRKLLTMQFYKNGNSTDAPRYDSEHWTNGSSRVTTYTGLYGQTLQQNGYSWPSGVWTYYTSNNGFSGISYLGQFKFGAADGLEVRDTNEVLFRAYQSDINQHQKLNYYLEESDGTYKLDASGTANNAGSFQFTEKYDGYIVKQYRRYSTGYYSGRFSPTWVGTSDIYIDDTWIDTSLGGEASLYYAAEYGSFFSPDYRQYYFSMDIRYDLKEYNLVFRDPVDNNAIKTINYTNTGANPIKNGSGKIKYSTSLNNYKPLADVKPVSTHPGKEWDGKWYSDQSCTTEFDWNTTMPSADVSVYPGWKDVYYRIEVEPNGGELSRTEATYFWLTYGEKVEQYIDIKRNYVKDDNGDIYYLINLWNQEWPDSADGDPRTARIARYSTDSSSTIEGVTVNSDGNKYKYREDAYSLIGWYELNEDGSIGAPYDFSTQVTKNTRIRALWRMSGKFKVVYDYEAVDETGKELTNKADGSQVRVTSVPSDGNSYADRSETAMLGKAGEPEEYQFKGWYYNGKVYNPGDVFEVLADIADEEHKVHVKPVLEAYENVPIRTTHINWYANTKDINGNDITSELTANVDTETDSKGVYYPQPDIQLNKGYDVLSASAFEYPGYEFIGWAKDAAATEPWLEYKNGQFYENDNVVTEVAADEKQPYDDLYALWRIKTYKVTIRKKVVGTENDKTKQFTFSSPALQQANFGLKDGDFKTFDVTYGKKFVLTESLAGDFSIFEPSIKCVLTDDDGEKTTTIPENGAEYTVTGNLDITYTNTRKTSKLTIMKKVAGEGLPYTDYSNGFVINVTLTAPDGTVTTEKVELLKGGKATEESNTIEVPFNAAYTVTESDPGNIFTVTYSGDQDAEVTENSISGTINKEVVEVTVTNTASKITDTGIDIDTTSAKAALLSLFAFAMMCLLGFSLKRRFVASK